MKILCVNNNFCGNNSYRGYSLTVNKYYTALPQDKNHNTYFLICDDNNNLLYYDKYRFLTLQQIRKEKIKKIGL